MNLRSLTLGAAGLALLVTLLPPSSPARAGGDSAAAAAASAAIPVGDEGRLIAYGRDILTKTQTLLPADVSAKMSCAACHNNAGRKPHAGSLLGVYAKFPQWNKRAHRFITLQDRLAECFLYSMNGRPPAYDSRAMIALTAYIAFISRGSTVGTGFANQGLIAVTPSHAPSAAAGKGVYERKCSACHGARGDGHNGAFPPLWGAKSFNASAGMHRLPTMAAFVRYNMPYGSRPNTLSAQEAYDVSAYVLAQPRPAFDSTRRITFPSRPAGFF
jgi:thiosulfate dehydrogenase